MKKLIKIGSSLVLMSIVATLLTVAIGGTPLLWFAALFIIGMGKYFIQVPFENGILYDGYRVADSNWDF